MPRVLLALLLAVVATAAVVASVLAGTSTDEPDGPPAAAPAYTSTPLTGFETDRLTIVRGSFCDAVSEDAVEEALGGEPRAASSYDNGERARLETGLRDVAHEFGCRWTGADATARAWVFAPPVTARSARGLARAARTEPACEEIPDAPAFGKPTAATTCQVGRDVEVTHSGLFGDAWLTCALAVGRQVPRAEAVDRAGRWCVAVATAARA